MHLTELDIILLAISLALLIRIMVSSLRRSSFGVLIMATEYFYIFGLTVFPMAAGLNLISLGRPLDHYVAYNGRISSLTSPHILMYCCGAFIGYFWATLRNQVCRIIGFIAPEVSVNANRCFLILILSSLVFSTTYIVLVGIDFALGSVMAARGGDLSEFGENVRYLYLKRLAEVGILGVIFVPQLIQRRRFSFALCAFLFAAAGLTYINSGSRNLIFESIIIPLAFVAYYSQGARRATVFAVVIPVAAMVYAYGKTFLPWLGAYVSGTQESTLASHMADYATLDGFLNHFGHLFLSVDAGIKSFITGGPLIPEDVLLSPFGVLPSAWMEALNLRELSYHFADVRFSDINSLYFGEVDASVPPQYSGASAYLLPIAGGVMFGIVRFAILGGLESAWIKRESLGGELWFIYLLFLIAHLVMLVIPYTISSASFIILIAAGIIGFVKLSRRPSLSGAGS